MNFIVATITSTFGFFSLITQVLLVLLVLVYLIYVFGKKKKYKNFINFLSENAIPFAFLVSFFATAGSLFLSLIAKLPPCDLCWYQRIFMFPQLIILGVAMAKNDMGVKRYVIYLSAIGSLLAVYHYVLQMLPLNLPCSGAISCSTKQLIYYGYITIPLMSLTAFLLILFFAFLIKEEKK